MNIFVKNKVFFFGILIIFLFASIAHASEIKSSGISSDTEKMSTFNSESPALRMMISSTASDLIDDDAVMGNPDAPVTLVEFGGYWEPFSYAFYTDTFPAIKSQYIDTGKVKFVFRDFPLEDLNPLDPLAAESAECVGAQGGDAAYFQMWNELSSTLEEPSYELYNQLALNIGYDIHSCLDNHQMTGEVAADFNDAVSLGLEGSPTFFVNDQRINGAYPFEVFQQAIETELSESIVCFENADCDDQDSGTEDFCTNPGTIQSACENKEIICTEDSDCGSSEFIGDAMCAEDGNVRRDYKLWTCENGGTSESSCNSDIENRIIEECEISCSDAQCVGEVFELKINSPTNDLSNDRKIFFNLSASEPVKEISYINYNDSNPKYKTLCKNCDEYGESRKKSQMLKEGPNNLKFRAVRESGETVEKDFFVFIDTKQPKIVRTEPKKGFASRQFYIEFSEINPLSLELFYGNSSREISLEDDCALNNAKYECSTEADLSEFDGEKISYWYELEDIAGNSIKSKPVVLDIDVTGPVLNEFNYSIDKRKVEFIFNVTEKNFDKISYVDASDSKPREVTLCSRLKNGECEAKKTFKAGQHNLAITVLDKAGNLIPRNVSFIVN